MALQQVLEDKAHCSCKCTYRTRTEPPQMCNHAASRMVIPQSTAERWSAQTPWTLQNRRLPISHRQSHRDKKLSSNNPLHSVFTHLYIPLRHLWRRMTRQCLNITHTNIVLWDCSCPFRYGCASATVRWATLKAQITFVKGKWIMCWVKFFDFAYLQSAHSPDR